jgi:hypothetical protein
VLVALPFLALRRGNTASRIAAVFTVVTLTGLAIDTADLLPAAIAASVVGVSAFRMRRDALSTTILSVASDFFAIVMTGSGGRHRRKCLWNSRCSRSRARG